MDSRPLAYDVGMNNGDDTEYYLKKGYRVVAIEANPTICDEAKRRFSSEIDSGYLKILNIGVAHESGTLDFYIDTWQHTTSTFVPQPNHNGRYLITPVDVFLLHEIFTSHGTPELLKIDIEGLDFKVLKSIFERNILPPLISAEAHSVDVLCLLIAHGYDQFKILEGGSVGKKISQQYIKTIDGRNISHQFLENSSGPFGDDYDRQWMSKEKAMIEIAGMPNTWRDVQCKHTRLNYLRLAQSDKSVVDPELEVELAYAYWRRYPDVAQADRFGEFGDLGLAGARTHFEHHGRSESRLWGEDG